MKKLLALLVLASTACQQQAPPTAAAPPARPAPAPTRLPPAPAGEKPLPVLFTAADTLARPARQLLAQYDLSPLWQGSTPDRREHPVLEGFFGFDHYRFMLVFTQVQCDAQHPELYWVRGKGHYRQNIRPFTGTLTVRRLADADVFYSPSGNSFYPPNSGSLPPDTLQARYERAASQARLHTAWARLQLSEEAADNSGVFEGEAVLNFWVAPPARVGYAQAPVLTEGEPGRGGWLLLRGSRRNVSTRQIKQFVVADDVFAAAPDVYKDFGIGDRGGELNPKYAHLGWNKKWENEEWWADSPAPRLTL